MKLLFVAAHPDDIEYGCTGTILRCKEQGHDIYIILMSNGENSVCSNENQRLTELNSSFMSLKIEQVTFLKKRDGFIECNKQCVQELTKIFDEIQPDIIFTHYYEDRHQDHRNTSHAVRAACWSKFNLLYFESFSSVDFSPTVYVDISPYVEKKQEIIECYKTQIEKYKNRNMNFAEDSIAANRKYGKNIRAFYAEGFRVGTYCWR